MAKVTKGHGFSGKIDNLVFFQTTEGSFVRKAPNFNKKKFSTHPNFARQREQSAEFSRAAKASKLLRSAALAFEFPQAKSGHSDLMKLMLQVIGEDQVNTCGERRPDKGNLNLLRNYDLLGTSATSFLKGIIPVSKIDRAKGSFTLSFDAVKHSPQAFLPASASHFQLICMGCELDFEGEQFRRTTALSQILPADKKSFKPLKLTALLNGKSKDCLLLLAGIICYEVINGKQMMLTAPHHSLCIIDVNTL